MKRNTYTLYLIAAFSLLLFSFSIDAMFTPTNLFQQRQKNREKLIADIDNAINQLKNDIYEELLTVASESNNTSYEDLKSFLDIHRITIKKALQNTNPSYQADHDPAIPTSTYHSILSSLEKNNISPENITLIYKQEQPDEKAIIFASSTLAYEVDHKKKYLHIDPIIDLYSSLTSANEIRKEFICFHEIQHILLLHSMIPTTTENADYITSIMEREADINAASRNIKIAQAAQIIRCTVGHAEITDNAQHCKDLTALYNLMKTKEALS